jgi:hypothetical protein
VLVCDAAPRVPRLCALSGVSSALVTVLQLRTSFVIALIDAVFQDTLTLEERDTLVKSIEQSSFVPVSSSILHTELYQMITLFCDANAKLRQRAEAVSV